MHVATDLRDGTWVVEIRTAPDAAWAVLDAAAGQTLTLAGAGERAMLTLLEPYPRGHSSPTGSGNRLWRAAYVGESDLPAMLARFGRPIAYGYLDRQYPIEDYQTVFGTTPGSAEMPSAARPFTPDVVTRLVSRGIAIAPILLHTGVSSQEAGEAHSPSGSRSASRPHGWSMRREPGEGASSRLARPSPERSSRPCAVHLVGTGRGQRRLDRTGRDAGSTAARGGRPHHRLA